MVRTNQGGSILNFIIVGVVLAVLLIGGAYYVRQKTQTSADTASAPAPSADQKTNSSQNSSKKQPAPSQSSDASKDKTTNGDDKKTAPAQTSAPAQAPASSTPPAATSNQLPQTGPGQTLSSIVALGLLGYMTVAYLRSRRARTLALTSLL